MVDVMRGKLGGVVFTKSRSGPTVRVRVRPANPATAAQINARANITDASRAYKALSSADAQAWRDYGLTFTIPNGVGGQFNPSGINAFTQLAAVYLAVNPGGTAPVTPPGSPYEGDTITVAGADGSGLVTFNPSAANTAGSTTELLVAKLLSPNRMVQLNDYRVVEYHVFTSGADNVDVTEPVGDYALAIRFVKIATGERGPLIALGTFQST